MAPPLVFVAGEQLSITDSLFLSSFAFTGLFFLLLCHCWFLFPYHFIIVLRSAHTMLGLSVPLVWGTNLFAPTLSYLSFVWGLRELSNGHIKFFLLFLCTCVSCLMHCKKESQVKLKKNGFHSWKVKEKSQKTGFSLTFMTESHFFQLYLTFFFTESDVYVLS